MGSKDKLRLFFAGNVGKVVSTKELRAVAGTSEYARRIRELRAQEGWDIQTHNDRSDLKPGQYILVSPMRKPAFARGISAELRAKVLQRNGMTCQVCGLGGGDADPVSPAKKVILQVDHIKPLSQGGTNDIGNLRVTCSVCNQGRSDLFVPASERAINFLSHLRRAPRDIQREVYQFLARKFAAEERQES